jgi:hypothetical protein
MIISTKSIRISLQRAQASLQDLEHIQETKSFTSNFTAFNIDTWIRAQQYEVEKYENLLNKYKKE